MSLESPKFELTKSRLDFYDRKPNKVDYDHQCFLARRLYEFLEPFDVYELEVDILGYKAEELFYGRPSINKAFVDLDRDYFSTYHSLTYSWLIVIPSELVNIFQKYAEADGFFVDREHGAKPIFYTYARENDEFICSSNNGRYSLPSLIRLLQDMGFENDVVWMSGKFYNAFQKHLRGIQCPLENKSVTAKDIIDYFELNEDYQIKRQDIFIFRYDWERYKRQQKEYIDSGIVPKQCSRRRVKSKINV